MKWTWDKFETEVDLRFHECSLLACILLNPKVLDDVLPLVAATDFEGPINRILFAHLRQISDSGAAVTLDNLRASLKESGDFGKTIDASDIARVFTEFCVPDSSHAIEHARLIRR